MRQAVNPHRLLKSFQSDNNVDSSYNTTEEERVCVLLGQGRNAVCSLPQKKSLACRCIEYRMKICGDIHSVDPSIKSNLFEVAETILKKWKNKNTIKNLDNKTHAQLLSKLMDIVVIIDNDIKLKEANKIGCNTRGGAKKKAAKRLKK